VANDQHSSAMMTVEGINERKRFFSSLEFFKGVEKERLIYLSQTAIKKKFSPAQTLIRQGDESDAIYFLSKGTVNLYRQPATCAHLSEKRLNLHSDTAMTMSQQTAAVRMFKSMYADCDSPELQLTRFL
jgi:CRP-like cAMP-binding protein